VWHIQELQEAGGHDVVFVFPVGVQPVPEVGLFRPATYASADAALKLLDPPAIPFTLNELGVNMPDLPDELTRRQWKFPIHLAWAAKRYLNEEYMFAAFL
jgi:hypothetical protein